MPVWSSHAAGALPPGVALPLRFRYSLKLFFGIVEMCLALMRQFCLEITKPAFSHPGQAFVRSRDNCLSKPLLREPKRLSFSIV